MSDTKIVTMSVRLSESVKKRLDKMALAEKRSITNMIQVVIEEAVEAHEVDSK